MCYAPSVCSVVLCPVVLCPVLLSTCYAPLFNRCAKFRPFPVWKPIKPSPTYSLEPQVLVNPNLNLTSETFLYVLLRVEATRLQPLSRLKTAS